MEEVENNEHCVPLKKSRLRKSLAKELELSDKKNRTAINNIPEVLIKDVYVQNPNEQKIKEEPVEMKEQNENKPTKVNTANTLHRQELPKKRWLREASLDKSLQESSFHNQCAPSLQELNQTRPTVLMLASKDDYMTSDMNEYTTYDDMYTRSGYVGTPTRDTDISEPSNWCSSTPNNTHKISSNNTHKFNGFPTSGISTFDTLDSSWTVMDAVYTLSLIHI